MKYFPRRRFLQLAASAAALPTISSIARAQTYPSRPITIVVGAAAGGASSPNLRAPRDGPPLSAAPALGRNSSAIRDRDRAGRASSSAPRDRARAAVRRTGLGGLERPEPAPRQGTKLAGLWSISRARLSTLITIVWKLETLLVIGSS